MRLGILGGTFNPIHEGHIRTADYFTETLSLDKVLLVPAKTPPHKETPDLATGRDRYNMCALAARAYPQLEACETELSMGEPSYTINTLEEILEEYPGANLFLLMGSDMFLTVQDWHRYDDIKELATICAVARDQGEKEDLLEHGRRLQAGGAEVFVGDMSPFPISSTEIRRKIFEGESTDRVLNGQERRYIDGLGLYKVHNNSFIQYDALVEKMEKPRRAFHSHCVASESARLAAMYGADVQKAYIAGLLHDILHNVSSVDMLQMVNDSDILLSSDQKEFPAVWHGILGAAWLKQEGIVSDEEILSAISHHTVGGSGMDTLDKVVFCADKTSLDRDYEDVWDARERVDESLNDGFQYIISYNIRSLLEHEESILKETWEAYNENVSALQRESESLNRRKAKTRSLRAMAILVIVMFVTGICSGGAYALYNSQLFAETGAVDENGSQITTKTTGIGINDENASLVDLNDESVNFLFVGVDESEALTDVIMIINMDMINKRITVLQIPRDTYVGESESRSSTGKINGIYGHPDTGKTRIQTLASYINNKFSVSIDHYATIDIDGFKSMVDVLGGVTMDVPQDVIYDGKIALYAGEQTLNGQQAEWFIRYRKGYLQGDIGRQDAQVVFLKALLDQMFEVTPKQAASIASQCISMVTTDMTVSDMVGYYNDVLQIGKDNVEFTRVPGEGINDWGPTRQSVWGVDTVELAEILNEYFRPNSEEVPASELGFLDYRDMESTTSYSYSGSGTTSSGDDDNSTNDTYSYNSRTGEYTASVEDVTGRAPTNSGSSSSRSGTTSESTSGALNGNASRSTNPSNTESNGGTLNGR